MKIENNILFDVDNIDIKNGEFAIPEGIKYIWNGAFFYCRNLISLVIPEGVVAIGSFAFERAVI